MKEDYMHDMFKEVKTNYGIGFCPVCGSPEIKYGHTEVADDTISQCVDCEKCKWSGIETSEMKFMGYYEFDKNCGITV